jgi:Branched-chain amino acid transport system / permease component
MSPRALLCLAGLAAAVLLPLVAPNYLVNVGMMVFFIAFIGQSWNIAGGFAGQTSFGHVVFFGTGAYTSTILQGTYGWNPWLAWPVAMAAGGAVGWMIAMLSFRAGLRGSYFALITLAFAEVFRILANSVPFTRGGLGMLIKADPRPINFQFRDPIWVYYLALLLCVVSILIAWRLTRSRFGARLVAIRENEDAARALGIDVFAEKVKVLALSGAMRSGRHVLCPEISLHRSQHRLRRRQVGRDAAGQHGGRRRHHLRSVDRLVCPDRHQRGDALARQRRAGAEERAAAQPGGLWHHAGADRGPTARWPDGPVRAKAAPCLRCAASPSRLAG